MSYFGPTRRPEYQRLDIAHPLNRGIILDFPLDERGGPVARNIAPSGKTGSRVSVAAGIRPAGRVAVFNGTSSYVNTGLTNQAFASGTISWWHNSTLAYNSGTVRGIWGALNLPYEFAAQVYSDNNWYVGGTYPTDKRLVFAATAGNFPQNIDTHYCFTWSSAGTAMYVNGTLAASSANIWVPNNINAPLVIGGQGLSVNRFTGAMWDFRLFNRVLNARERHTLYRLPATGRAAFRRPDWWWMTGAGALPARVGASTRPLGPILGASLGAVPLSGASTAALRRIAGAGAGIAAAAGGTTIGLRGLAGTATGAAAGAGASVLPFVAGPASAAGLASAAGASAATLGQIAGTGLGTAAISGASVLTFGVVIGYSASGFSSTGSSVAVFAPFGGTAVAQAAINAASVAIVAPVTGTAAGAAAATAASAATFASPALVAAGAAAIVGTAVVTFRPVTGTSSDAPPAPSVRAAASRTVVWPAQVRRAEWPAESRLVSWPAQNRTVTWQE